MMKFKDLDKKQQCLLIGRTANKYDKGMSVEEIAEKLNKPVELVEEMVEIIIKARNNKD